MKTFNAEQNRKDRMKFVEFWAEYVKTHPDKDWSRQQAKLINSQIKNARWIYKKVLKEDKELQNRKPF